MRILFALPLLLLGACQVSKDNGNDTVAVTYNEDLAENVAADVGNAAENLADKVGNDVKQSADKVQNKVGNTDIDIDTDKDDKTVANKQ